MQTSSDKRYPIGTFDPPAEIFAADRRNAILTLTELPHELRAAVHDLQPEQINTPYREGGWTVRQVVHHLADSHATALFRLKKALTEDWPTVPGYNEADFANLRDVEGPLEWSLDLLHGVHARWAMLLTSLDDAQWQRGFVHAERGRMSVEFTTLNYAWHSKHHLAHINSLRLRHGW